MFIDRNLCKPGNFDTDFKFDHLRIRFVQDGFIHTIEMQTLFFNEFSVLFV